MEDVDAELQQLELEEKEAQEKEDSYTGAFRKNPEDGQGGTPGSQD